MLIAVFALLAGALALYFGASLLIRGSSALARALGVAPAVIGLTVVAFGTSLPELVVTLTAALRGSADMALGNVVGSNIANIGLILGAAAALHAISVEFTLLRREAPMGMAALALLIVLSLDGTLGRLDGALLLAGFFAFVFWSVKGERVAPETVQEGAEKTLELDGPKGGLSLVFCVAGLLMVLLGGYGMVEGGVRMADILGVPKVIVGLTIVAVGTSLPELATSLMAVSKGEDDIGLGGVLGSNLFNILGVLGIATLLDPIEVPATFFKLQYPVLAAFTIALFPIAKTGVGVSRKEGAFLLIAYFVYVAALYSVGGVG